MSNASDDFPDPETPVNTVNRCFGTRTDTSRRLWVRAPSTVIHRSRPAVRSSSVMPATLRSDVAGKLPQLETEAP
ncbi:hypothetical protein GCM10022220_11200 [Actinocatenispora rupis]